MIVTGNLNLDARVLLLRRFLLVFKMLIVALFQLNYLSENDMNVKCLNSWIRKIRYFLLHHIDETSQKKSRKRSNEYPLYQYLL